MQWLNELPFADNRVLQIGSLAACGIAALIVLAIVYRLAFAHRLRVPGGRTRQPRLGLVDAFSLDGQRQLVLVRRDNVEHLVMIGGPNDVLVELQINRAAAPARESNQVSPLLVPSTPVRRTEAAALSAPPAPALASPPAPAGAPPIPKAPAPAQAPAPIPLQAPAPAQATGPVAAQARAPVPAEQARPAAAPSAAAQAAEPIRPAPASAPSRQPEQRPAQPRATMPPPIIPANASPNRGAVRTTETAPSRGPGNLPTRSPVAPAPARRPEKPEPAVAAARSEPEATGPKSEPDLAPVKTEPSSAPTVTTPPQAGAALAQARLAPKTPPSAPASDGAPKFIAPARPAADKATAARNGEPAPKVDDPFADIDSLEAEMARLLGREKPD